jgi:hypothetical protein
MTLAKLHTIPSDGRVCLRWRVTTANGTIQIQRALTADFSVGLVTLQATYANTNKAYDDVVTNGNGTPYWYRITDIDGTVSTADEAFACGAPFLAPDNFYRIPMGASAKAIFVSDAAATPPGSDANPGTDPGQPCLTWASGVASGAHGNWLPGDCVFYERGRTITQQLADYHPNAVTFTTYSVFGAYGQRSVARPIIDGSTSPTVPAFNFQATGGTANKMLFAIEHLDFSCNVAARAANDVSAIQIVAEQGVGGSGGTFYVQGCKIKQWYFGLTQQSQNQNGRWQNCVLHRNVIQRTWAHGTGQNPSGALFDSCDGLTLWQNILDHCGFDETSPAMNVGAIASGGASTTYTSNVLTDASGKTWTVNAYAGRMLWVTGQTFGRIIASNTANTITLAGASGTGDSFNQLGDGIPAANTTYIVAEGGTPSQFRHGWYIQDTCTNVTAYGNVAYGSDLMCRSAGKFYRNYMVKCSIGFTVGGWNSTGVGGLDIDVKDNFNDGASPLDIIQYSGGMIGYLGTSGHTCNSISVTGHLANGHALEGLDFYAGGLDILGTVANGVKISDSVLIWKNRGIQFPNPMSIDNLGIVNCTIWVTARLNQQNCIGSSGAWAGGTQVIAGNSYFSVDAAGATTGVFYAGGDASFASMRSQMNDLTSIYLPAAPSYTERRGGDYAGSVGLGANVAAFMTAAAGNRFGSWDARYMAEPLISYCRQGYGMSALGNLPVDVPIAGGVTGGHAKLEQSVSMGRSFGIRGRGDA